MLKCDKWFNLLTVKVVEAKNLPAVNISGTSDCYCVVTCEYEYARTSTIWKNNKNPFWGETFDFSIQHLNEAILRIFILDEELVVTDECFGYVEIDSLTDTEKKPIAKWYPVIKPYGFFTGHLVVHITRTEKIIRVLLVSGRNLPSADPNGKSDPYVRLEFGGKKKKSKIVKKTLNPDFNEEFVFEVGKTSDNTLYLDVFDWDFIGSDDYLGSCHVVIETSKFKLAETCPKLVMLKPKITQEEIDLHKAKYSGTSLGTIRLQTSLVRRRVHNREVYSELLELLIDPNFATILLIQGKIKDNGAFGKILVAIFDGCSQLSLLSNALTNYEISNTPNPDIIFRGNSLVTKTLDALMKFVGQEYQEQVLGTILSDICSKKKLYEVDPQKISAGNPLKISSGNPLKISTGKANISKNVNSLKSLCNTLLDKIFSSVEDCPPIMLMSFLSIRRKVESTYKEEQIQVVKYTSISAFIFLRFFCPAIINPKLFGFVAKFGEIAARNCTLLAKLIQNLANLVNFSDKEPYMKVFNDFIEENIPKMKDFIDRICLKAEASARNRSRNRRLGQDTWIEKELAMAATQIRTCQKGWYSEDNPLAVNLAEVLENIYQVDQQEGDFSMEI